MDRETEKEGTEGLSEGWWDAGWDQGSQGGRDGRRCGEMDEKTEFHETEGRKRWVMGSKGGRGRE